MALLARWCHVHVSGVWAVIQSEDLGASHLNDTWHSITHHTLWCTCYCTWCIRSFGSATTTGKSHNIDSCTQTIFLHAYRFLRYVHRLVDSGLAWYQQYFTCNGHLINKQVNNWLSLHTYTKLLILLLSFISFKTTSYLWLVKVRFTSYLAVGIGDNGVNKLQYFWSALHQRWI